MRSKPFSWKSLLFSCVLLQFGCSSPSTTSSSINQEEKLSGETISKVYQEAASQYKLLASTLPEGKFPKTYHPTTGKLDTSGSDWWCSGFYPGTLLNLYQATGDKALYAEATRIMEDLKKEQYNTSTHDLGFMMYCSFGKANQLAPKPEYRDILLNSAKSLSTRFNPTVGAIKSWDSDQKDFLVIIDNMMNLELLFWATRVSGDSSFHKLAVTHANTTLQHHFRPDHSSYHVINYDPNTGAVQQKKTAQGYADESAWARGQAWGLYGYTATYRETKDPRYLNQATRIADFILNHPNLPEDKIPYWDFNAPNIPSALRDASAGAINAAALLELSQYVPADVSKKYFKAAQTMLQTLSTDTYRAAPGTNGGFLLKHGVGHNPQGTEIDVPLTYGDYYYIEALQRYQELTK
ncbi:glycoside hydrolase family 88 protein [Rufibacter latericius]|uniref:Glucuronyl hydrolase n=1 Tax=Rufibacter latericius TaxID=2487040 RepID=A0A3M9N2M2_9BACT|nr:glycoside hydrolase family 88 protein [Rufibacter latericius]RNI31268.1 glucuronyl hydrolase [Rufibacter latericius]